VTLLLLSLLGSWLQLMHARRPAAAAAAWLYGWQRPWFAAAAAAAPQRRKVFALG
jgi:hypothetical protein